LKEGRAIECLLRRTLTNEPRLNQAQSKKFMRERNRHYPQSREVSAIRSCRGAKSAHRMRRMKTLLALLLALMAVSSPALAVEKEYVVLTGGVSLYAWEKFKGPQAHDHWWANFVHASRLRFEQIRQEAGPDAKITWLIYKESYLKRSKQEGRDLIPLIESVRDAYNLKLVWFEKGSEVIDYLNNGQPRDEVKIADFEYFGHSNKACWMFDYSAEVDSASKSWLHETDFSKLKRGIFAKDAYVKSWGCHTGESMNQKFARATGIKMWGAVGRTQYETETLPSLAQADGKWVR
jgi:hypothetical protein